MKKFAVILFIAFVTALVMSSCNREVCPAYSKADTQLEEVAEELLLNGDAVIRIELGPVLNAVHLKPLLF